MFRRFASFAASVARRLFKSPPPERPFAEVPVPVSSGPKPRSGVGASVAANKVKGIRAGLCHDHYSVRQGVEDDDMNVLCLGGRVMGIEVAWDHAQTFISATFSGAERHRRRLAKVARLEERPTGTT